MRMNRFGFIYDGAHGSTLWIVRNGSVYTFQGGAIPEVVEIVSVNRIANRGGVALELAIPDDARCCVFTRSAGDTVWPDDSRLAALSRFRAEFAIELGFDSFDQALSRSFPAERARMVARERAHDLRKRGNEFSGIEK